MDANKRLCSHPAPARAGLRAHRPRVIAIGAVTGLLAALATFGAAGEVYRYRDAEGRWQFSDRPPPGSVVVTGDSGPAAGGEGADVPSASASDKDLAARLEKRFRPETPVERATLAAVAIEAALGQGSGFFVSPDGYILTNRHVVRPDEPEPLAERRRALEREERHLEAESHRYTPASVEEARRRLREERRELDWQLASAAAQASFTIRLKDGESLHARLVAVGRDHDLALLKLDGYRTPSLAPAADGPPRQGETVHAIGNPLGVSDNLTTGRVTRVGRDVVVTDVQLLPGNSGGPLVNEAGEVLGINFAKRTQGGNANYQGLGLAVPWSAAVGELPELR